MRLLWPGLLAGIAGAVVASWQPRWAEFVTHRAVDTRVFVPFVALALMAWAYRPADFWRFIVPPGLCLVCLVAGLALGLVFVPAETRGGTVLPPGPEPAPQSTLADRLREPWSSVREECPPAAIDLARCSLLAYETPGQWRKSVPALGFEDHVPVVQGSAKAVVLILGDEAVVAFQGTDDSGDWLTNLDMNLADPPDDPVHRGFLGAYRSVAGQVHDALRAHGIRHVWITGHSLGGAMGVLCALDLVRAGEFAVRGVITFGQPLLLAPAFAAEANGILAGRHLRFIHEDDVVTRLVPGFRGGGSSIWFKEGVPVFNLPRMRAMAPDGDAGPEATEIEDGPPPLTPEEFEALKVQIRQERIEPAEPEPGEAIVARALPTSRDHPMTLYLEALQHHFPHAVGGRAGPGRANEGRPNT